MTRNRRDNFAGGGRAASQGIEAALRPSHRLRDNHDREAIAMHARITRRTKHLTKTWKVGPARPCSKGAAYRWRGFLRIAPFTQKARGGKPFRECRSVRRGVCADSPGWWLKWARLPKEIRPAKSSLLENVEELRIGAHY